MVFFGGVFFFGGVTFPAKFRLEFFRFAKDSMERSATTAVFSVRERFDGTICDHGWSFFGSRKIRWNDLRPRLEFFRFAKDSMERSATNPTESRLFND